MFSAVCRCFSASKRVFTLCTQRLPRVISQRDTYSDTMSTFPTTLKGFGYAFNDDGKLRQIDPKDDSITDKPFQFDVSDDSRHNQAHYEALGEVITEHVYQLLQEAGLHKIYVPSPESPNSSFVFGTKTDFKDTKKLLFLIHGSGVVRAGQWSRSLIINQSTNHGSQLPYIKRAIEFGYDVLVTNTNNNYRFEDGKRVVLEENRSPEQHIISVWEQLIAPVFHTIDSFAVVAHSYGGIVTLEMVENYPEAFLEKCFAIAFTDSVHYAGGMSGNLFNWFKKNARNYVTSSKPLGTELDSRSQDIPIFSAGHTKHEWTSWACIDALFPFLEEKYESFLKENRKQKPMVEDEAAFSAGDKPSVEDEKGTEKTVKTEGKTSEKTDSESNKNKEQHQEFENAPKKPKKSGKDTKISDDL